MALLDEAVLAKTREILGEMRAPVGMTFFTLGPACAPCGTVGELLAELAAAEPRLRVETRDYHRELPAALALGIHHAPAVALRHPGEERFPVRYYGVPSGLEYGALLRTLVLFSTGRAMAGLAAAAAAVGRETNVKVFVLAA